MLQLIKRFSTNESGATVVEYGLVAGIIAVSIIAGATTVGDTLGDTFNDIYIAIKGDDS